MKDFYSKRGVLFKAAAIPYLKGAIKSLERRAASGEIRFIETELNCLREILCYVKAAPAPKQICKRKE